MESDTKESRYIGKLANGKNVYDKEDSNWLSAHKVVTLDLLQEALGKIDTQDDLFVGAVDMGRIVGKTYCVPVTELDQVFGVRRKGRKGETPTILNKPPVDSSKVTVVLNKQGDDYVLATTYIGESAPMEPWDSNLLESQDEEKIQESKDFWSTHALVYDSTVVEFVVLKDGTKLSKEEFEKQYIYNANKYKFDIPDNALLLLMGVLNNNKKLKAKGIANYLNGQIISFDDVRDEIFSDDIEIGNKDVIYSEESKNRVYDEMLKRTEENLDKGTFTIADATFLFDTGKRARTKFYELAQKFNRPLRVIMLKVPLQLAIDKNKNREEKLDNQVVENMWKFMNNTYSTVTSELMTLPDTKFELLGQPYEISR